MAASLGRICRSGLLKSNNRVLLNQANQFSTVRDWSMGRKALLSCLGVTAGGIGALIYALEHTVKADDLVAHPPTYGWGFNGLFNSLDHASMRRGWEVYKNVCSACHSLNFVAYRHLVNTTHTESEAKAFAAEIQVRDGPDETGEFYMRPGKLSDYVPAPYRNEEIARAANNGANPPDLSYIVNARHNGENYVFSLLTGYCEPPAGIPIRDGLYFNPYFPGGTLGMAQVIYDEVIEYEDGTPASASQVAKDVTEFLKWTSNHEWDDRKRIAIKMLGIMSLLITAIFCMTRHKWTTMHSVRVMYIPRNKK